jgi:protein TonB
MEWDPFVNLIINNCFMIDTNKILQADLLEIIFDGRNKEYGAYELRVNYKRRLYISVISMIMICGFLLLLYSFASGSGNKHAEAPVIIDTQLDKIDEKKPEEPVVIEKPKPIEKPIAMRQFTPPVITNEVKPDEVPPAMEELEETKIGTIDIDGDKDDGIVAPPLQDDGKGIVVAPKKDEEDWERTFVSVQIESQYPGGTDKWHYFLNRNLRYPDEAVEKEIQGTVVVQFIVDKEGVVSEVQAISGPEELQAEAVRVIKKSGKWVPAEQNGRKVKSYKKQPIKFQLAQE